MTAPEQTGTARFLSCGCLTTWVADGRYSERAIASLRRATPDARFERMTFAEYTGSSATCAGHARANRKDSHHASSN